MKEVDDMQKNLKKFYNRNKKAVIIGGVVAVAAIGIGSSLIFNQSPANNNKSGALNNPTAISTAAEKKNVVREDVPISTLSSFDIYIPNYTDDLDGYYNANDSMQDRVDGDLIHIFDTKHGVDLLTENQSDPNTEDPVCRVRLGVESRRSLDFLGYKGSSDDVMDIAKGLKVDLYISYENKNINPLIEERVSDVKIQSKDGTKNYTIPTVRFASPHGGEVRYFGASKMLNDDFVIMEVGCIDSHGSNGIGGSQTIPQDVIDKNWKILDTIKIKPTE